MNNGICCIAIRNHDIGIKEFSIYGNPSHILKGGVDVIDCSVEMKLCSVFLSILLKVLSERIQSTIDIISALVDFDMRNYIQCSWSQKWRGAIIRGKSFEELSQIR